MTNNSGLYIHLPFCVSKCAYCDFYSTPHSQLAPRYVDALRREFDARIAGYPLPAFTTVYLGGGTPSSLPPALLDSLMTWLPLDEMIEMTVEVNPEDVTPDFIAWLRSSPVNRVSMGVQSLSDAELSLIGRRHNARRALDAYADLRRGGSDNISLDLIFGLPGQTIDSWTDTLRRTLALQPDHLSAYALMIEPGTRLWAMKQARRFTEPSQELSDAMYRRLCTATVDAGLNHYEISNFAMPGRHSRHNSAYWDLSPYLGLGAGAHSHYADCRYFNPSDLRGYIAAPESFTRLDPETPEERINDYIMIRLRTANGLSSDDFARRFGTGPLSQVIRNATPHAARGNIIMTATRIAIPHDRFLISDTIIPDIFI